MNLDALHSENVVSNTALEEEEHMPHVKLVSRCSEVHKETFLIIF